MRFFDTYPRFYETTRTLLKPNRFQQRWRMIVDGNRSLFENARVLDLAAHDGRWSFAALTAGAAYVEGVEARADLVEGAKENFRHYGVGVENATFVCDDAVAYLEAAALPRFDVVLNLGFLYHTMKHMQVIEGMARTGARHFVIDTSLTKGAGALIKLMTEDADDFRNAVRADAQRPKNVLVGAPSKDAVRMMLDDVGYDCDEIDWFAHVDDFAECDDYREGFRTTFVATRRAPGA